MSIVVEVRITKAINTLHMIKIQLENKIKLLIKGSNSTFEDCLSSQLLYINCQLMLERRSNIVRRAPIYIIVNDFSTKNCGVGLAILLSHY